MKVLHIINSLKKGGAESNLFRLCKEQKKKYKNRIDITVITLINNGYYENFLKKIGVKVFTLKIDKNNNLINFIKTIIKLRKIIKFENPDIIQTWMYHSNFISLFIPIKFHKSIFWNIRHSELNLKISKKKTVLVSILCGLISRIIPKKIIYCSEKSIKFHENFHFYSRNKTDLIYNGYDISEYYSSEIYKSKFRREKKIKNTDIVLGYAGRFAKQKNIDSLLIAFSKSIKKYNNLYLVMAGKNINYQNDELYNLIIKYKIKNKVFLVGEQKNLLKFYNGIDFLVSSSHSESFPNVIAESMLCSTPVLSSDAGCAKKIINNKNFILKRNDYLTIAEGIKQTINLLIREKKKWKILKTKARKQIVENFSIEKMSENYIRNWTF